MKVKVGLVEIEGPDTLSADQFGQFIDAVNLRLYKLADVAVQLIPATAATVATAATITPATEPTPVG